MSAAGSIGPGAGAPGDAIVYRFSESEAADYWRALGRRQTRSGRVRYSVVSAFLVPALVMAMPLALLALGHLDADASLFVISRRACGGAGSAGRRPNAAARSRAPARAAPA